MKYLSHLLFLLPVLIHTAKGQEIYQPGPYTVQHELYLSMFNMGLDHNVDVWAPDAAGEFPVIFFMPGFTGIMPAEIYWNVLEKVSSHGYVVIGIWTLSELPTTQVQPEWLHRVRNWLQNNLRDKLDHDGFNKGLVLDFTRLFLMAHSAGSHIMVNYLKSDFGCENVNGLILLSPVDGLDPYGFLDYYCITPGEKLNFETPTLIIGTGYDHIPGIGESGVLFPACAPAEVSNLRFWNAINGEAWFINATEYGHGDVYIEIISDDLIDMLRTCHPGTGPIPLYHNYIAGQAVAFIKAVHGDCDMMQYLEDSTLMPIAVETRRQYGSELACQRGGYCIHV